MYLVFNLTKYKELYLLEYNLCNGKKFILHGSCGSGVIGKIEYDTAMCLLLTFGLILLRRGKIDVAHGLILSPK